MCYYYYSVKLLWLLDYMYYYYMCFKNSRNTSFNKLAKCYCLYPKPELDFPISGSQNSWAKIPEKYT